MPFSKRSEQCQKQDTPNEVIPMKSHFKELKNKDRTARDMKNEGMAYLFTFGYSLDIYAKGNHRVGIDRNTGETVIEYTVVAGPTAPREQG